MRGGGGRGAPGERSGHVSAGARARGGGGRQARHAARELDRTRGQRGVRAAARAPRLAPVPGPGPVRAQAGQQLRTAQQPASRRMNERSDMYCTNQINDSRPTTHALPSTPCYN